MIIDEAHRLKEPTAAWTRHGFDIAAKVPKPITQARGEIEKCAKLCEWYAEHGPAMLDAEPTQVEDGKARIEYRPLDSVLAVMPWNFPVWQVLRGAVPARDHRPVLALSMTLLVQ